MATNKVHYTMYDGTFCTFDGMLLECWATLPIEGMALHVTRTPNKRRWWMFWRRRGY